MVRHVVCFRWNPGTGDDAIDAVAAGLRVLPEAIETIRAYRFGRDLGLVDTTWDFTVTADFDDVEGYLTYRDHPAHQQLINERILPIVADRVAVQFEAG
jgi:hypothetical protein